MLSFSDEELASITELASPLSDAMRSDFLQRVANRIEGYPPQTRGPGLLHRIAAEVQRDFLNGQRGCCWEVGTGRAFANWIAGYSLTPEIAKSIRAEGGRLA